MKKSASPIRFRKEKTESAKNSQDKKEDLLLYESEIKNWRIVLGLVLFGCAIFVVRMWDGVLLEDPARYASVAKCIVDTGDWVTMHETPSRLYFNKPPLYFWLTAILFKLFGVSVGAARFFSAASGVVLMLLVYDIVRRFRAPGEAALSALILGLTNDFISYTSVGRLDGPICLCITLSIWSWIRFHTSSNKSWLLGPGIFTGVGLMVKGPPAFMGLATVILIVFAVREARKTLFAKQFWIGIIIGFAIAAPWHIAVGAANPEFWNHYFGHEMLDRGKWLEPKSRLHFVKVFVEHYLPWTPFAVWGLYKAFRSWFAGKQTEAKKKAETEPEKGNTDWYRPQKCKFELPHDYARILICWLLVMTVMSFIPARMYGRYLVPMFPVLACLSGAALRRLIPDTFMPEVCREILPVSIILFIIMLLQPFPRHKSDADYNLEKAKDEIHAASDREDLLAVYNIEIQHAPEAMFYFYFDRELKVYKTLDKLIKDSPDIILTSKAGMKKLASHDYEAASEAKELFLAKKIVKLEDLIGSETINENPLRDVYGNR